MRTAALPDIPEIGPRLASMGETPDLDLHLVEHFPALLGDYVGRQLTAEEIVEALNISIGAYAYRPGMPPGLLLTLQMRLPMIARVLIDDDEMYREVLRQLQLLHGYED